MITSYRNRNKLGRNDRGVKRGKWNYGRQLKRVKERYKLYRKIKAKTEETHRLHIHQFPSTQARSPVGRNKNRYSHPISPIYRDVRRHDRQNRSLKSSRVPRWSLSSSVLFTFGAWWRKLRFAAARKRPENSSAARFALRFSSAET